MNLTKKQSILSISNINDISFTYLLISFLITIALLTYGIEIFNFSLSIDEELQSFDSNNWRTWISQGRWGMGFLTYIFPHGIATMPLLPTLMFATGLVISAILFSRIFVSNRESTIVFTGVFITSPIWLHIGEFNTLSWGFSLGLILTAIALKYLNLGGIKNAAISGICIGFSLSIYQSLFILYLSLTFLLYIKTEWHLAERKQSNFINRNARIFFDSFISIVIALVFYLCINELSMYFSDTRLSYLNNYIGLTAYTNGDSASAVKQVIDQTKGFFLGSNSTFLGVGIPSLLLFWFGAFFVIKELYFKNISLISKCYILLLCNGVLLLAVLLIILSAGVIPTRALIVFPIIYAILSAVLFKYKKFKKIMWSIFGVMLFVNIYIANSLLYADQVARQRDLVMATRLIDEVEDVGRDAFGEKIPLVIIGSWQHEQGGPAHRVEIFGDSFFEHDGGNPYRVAAYFRLLGSKGLTPLSITKVGEELSGIRMKPSWPAKGSVFLTKHAVVIKLSEPSYQQGLALQIQ